MQETSKNPSENSCSVDISDTKDTVSKYQQNRQKMPAISPVGGIQQPTYFARSFISQEFFYTLGTTIFRNTSERLLFIFFFDYNVLKKNLPIFCFFLKKIRLPALVSYKLELEVCLIIPNVSLKIFPAFQNIEQNIEVAFERSFTKVVVQQNDTMKYTSATPMAKSRKVLHANLQKKTHHRHFSKNLTTSSEQGC